MKKTVENQVINTLINFVHTNEILKMTNLEIKEIHKDVIYEFWGSWYKKEKKLCFTLKREIGDIQILLDGGKYNNILNYDADFYDENSINYLTELLSKIDCKLEFENPDCLLIYNNK